MLFHKNCSATLSILLTYLTKLMSSRQIHLLLTWQDLLPRVYKGCSEHPCQAPLHPFSACPSLLRTSNWTREDRYWYTSTSMVISIDIWAISTCHLLDITARMHRQCFWCNSDFILRHALALVGWYYWHSLAELSLFDQQCCPYITMGKNTF